MCPSFESGRSLPEARTPDAAPISALPLVGRKAEGYHRRRRGCRFSEPRITAMDIAAWLQGLVLERYVPAFRDNEIDWEVLPKLTSEDLREIGVAAIGHRRKLLDAIAALGATVPTAALTTAAPSDAPAPTDAE